MVINGTEKTEEFVKVTKKRYDLKLISKNAANGYFFSK